MKKIYILAILLIVITFTACNNFESNNGELENVDEQQSEVLEVTGEFIISASLPQTLNPLTNMDIRNDQNLKLIFDSLIEIDENLKPVPGLAESWEINEIGTAINLKLKENVMWHNGTMLTADDVIYSLDVIRSAQDSLYSKNMRNILSYQKLDDFNVKINYNKPAGDILYTLYIPIIPQNYYKGAGEDKDLNPVGSGKYKFVSYEPMKQIILELNESYYKKSGSIKNIFIKIIPDEEVAIEAFKQNQIDFIYSEEFNIMQYIDNKKINSYKYSTLYFDFLGFNFQKLYLKDKEIRQAIAKLLNKKDILSKYYLGLGDIANTPIHSKSWLTNEALNEYKYDKNEAKRQISELIDLNSKKITLTIIVNEENYQRVNIANILKTELDKIGFNTIVEKDSMDVYLKKVENGEFDLMLGGWKLSKYPDLTFMLNSSEIKNYGKYKDAKMDLLLEKAFLSFNENDMKNAYIELQNYISEELPIISLFFKQNVVYTSSKLEGNLKPLQWNIFNGIENCSINEQ